MQQAKILATVGLTDMPPRSIDVTLMYPVFGYLSGETDDHHKTPNDNHLAGQLQLVTCSTESTVHGEAKK